MSKMTKVTNCVRGVFSPLLSNIYLNEIDKMLEKAKEATREGKYVHLEYARFADDAVILVDGHHKWDWLWFGFIISVFFTCAWFLFLAVSVSGLCVYLFFSAQYSLPPVCFMVKTRL